MDTNILPYGKISSPQKLGDAVRAKRKADGLTQAKAAALCGVGVRFISDLENGKPTAEFGKILSVLNALGLTIDVRPKGSWHQKTLPQSNLENARNINQDRISNFSLNALSKLADTYQGTSTLSAQIINDLAKHRNDYNSLGISINKLNDIVKSNKHNLDLSSTAVSSLSNTLNAIDNLGITKSTLGSTLNSFQTSLNISKDALSNIKDLQSTFKSLNLNTSLVDSLQNNYRDNLKLSKSALQKLRDYQTKFSTQKKKDD